MTAPPWGHKPPAVDRYAYWRDPPPEPSPRLTYWMRRLTEGSWHPNKYLRREGYDTAAEITGVYIWEWWNVLGPACDADARARQAEARGTVAR